MTTNHRARLVWTLAGTVAALALILQVAPSESPGGTDLGAFEVEWPTAERVTLLVDLREDLRPEDRAEALRLIPQHAQANRTHSVRHGLFRLELPADEALALAEQLRSDPRIRTVEPEMMIELDPSGLVQATSASAAAARPDGDAPDDPLYPFQWNFRQVNAEGAWARARGAGVVVAVIDTGVAYEDATDLGVRAVRDLEGTRFVQGHDFVDRTPRGLDFHGHGTHVAGTIAQTTGNGYGVAGLAPEATIMPLRVLDAQGRGATGDIADAIRFAADNGAHIINMSLGGPLPSRVMADAVAYARRKGVVVIAAAGNNGWSMPSYPAAYRGVIAVAATQYDRTTTFYSNYGKYIDIAAPGGNTRVDQVGDGQPDGIMQETIARGNPADHEFALYMGTSMAAPHVAAVAALIRSTGVTHPDRIESLLLRTASQDVPVFERERYGAGIVDAEAATRAALLHLQAPRLPLAFLGALLALVLAGQRRGLRAIGAVPFIGASMLAATGFALPGLALHLAGLPLVTPAPLESGLLHWGTTLGGPPALTSNLLLLSALPIIGLYAVFGQVRRSWATGLLLGTMAGLSMLLLAEAVVPLHDVRGVPGMGLLDRIWLGANAAIGLVVTAIAARRDV